MAAARAAKIQVLKECGKDDDEEKTCGFGLGPAGGEQVIAETEASPELEQTIIDYYEILKESW